MEDWRKRLYIFRFITCHQKGKVLTQFLLPETPELGHLVKDCGRGMGPMMSRCRHFWGQCLEFSSQHHLAAQCSGKSTNFGAGQTWFLILTLLLMCCVTRDGYLASLMLVFKGVWVKGQLGVCNMAPDWSVWLFCPLPSEITIQHCFLIFQKHLEINLFTFRIVIVELYPRIMS